MLANVCVLLLGLRGARQESPSLLATISCERKTVNIANNALLCIGIVAFQALKPPAILRKFL